MVLLYIFWKHLQTLKSYLSDSLKINSGNGGISDVRSGPKNDNWLIDTFIINSDLDKQTIYEKFNLIVFQTHNLLIMNSSTKAQNHQITFY